MRQYQPIWEAVRTKGTASLAADPAIHFRIRQAVRKEKCKDLGWKMECLDSGKKYELLDKSEGSLLTFTLIEVVLILPIMLSSL